MKKRNFNSAIAAFLACMLLFSLAGCSFEVETIETPAPAAQLQASETPHAPAEPEPTPTPEPTTEPTPEPTEEPINGILLADDDGDGIINYKFNYKGATVYAMFILDPGRVFLGTAVTDPSIRWGNGKTLDVMLTDYDAVAGMNAGVFLDDTGTGSGWPPTGITVNRGVCYNAEEAGPVVGIDSNNKLIVGYYSYQDTLDLELQNVVSFGPIFVQNGVKADTSSFEAGIGARSAIGQRADGTIVFMAADGRQGYSIGLTLADCADILFDKFGCVDAANMDGGNSTCMAYGEALVNNPSNKAGGTRNMPTSWLVERMTEDYVAPEGTAKRVILPYDVVPECSPCSEEQTAGLQSFAAAFLNAYYGYFGTANADYYYPTLLQYVAAESDLKHRMDLALGDRGWVNSFNNVINNCSFEGAYDNGDGSFTICCCVDLVEYSNYWTYEAANTMIEITVVPAADCSLGYRAVSTK